jgi:hypothetical protein
MKKALLFLAAVVLAAMPAMAGEKATDEFKATGWIVDAQCGKSNANAKGAECIKSCNKNGSPLVLSVGDKIYKISDQKLAKENIGFAVEVKGTLKGDTVEVASISKAGKA